MNSKVYTLTAPRTLELTETPLDTENLKPDEIVCETLVSVISPGTEIAAYRGDPALRPSKIYPRVVGYCNVAKITASGGQGKVGSLVLTHQSHRSHFRVPMSKVICQVPSGVPLVAAASTYLYHLPYACLLKTEYFPGSFVGVVGLGALGMAAVDLVSRFGGRVAAFSEQEVSRTLAEKWGAATFGKSLDANFHQSVFGKEKFDLVILTTNSWADLKLAASMTRKGGKIAVLGFPGRAQPLPSENPLDTQFFYDSQISLVYCGFVSDTPTASWEVRFNVSRNCEYLLAMIGKKELHVSELVPKTVPAHQIKECYEQLMNRSAMTPLTFALDWSQR